LALCLVVEDRPAHGKVLAGTLRAAGHQTLLAEDGREARRHVEEHRPEIVLLDLGLPDVDGLALIPELLALSPLSRIVVITGLDSVAGAVAALRAGARHYLVKPWEREELLLVVEREARRVDVEEARRRNDDGAMFWGSAAAMDRLRRQVEKLSAAPRTPVLLEGATGTGKELVAREIHRRAACEGAFVAVNCAALPAELLESELFGHEKGAFTGAVSRRRGLAELAREGTLFLDEVAELAAPLQAKLLRFLEDHRFRRLGGEVELESPCRVVAATHQDLEERVSEGAFRSDLYYRLAVVRLRLPPLAERREDILPLASFVMRQVARNLTRRPRQLTPAAEEAVLAHAWPGNVRELRNRLEKALVLGEGVAITPEDMDLRLALRGGRKPSGDEASRLLRALTEEGWNVARTARRLGVERHWLRYRMAKHGLQRPEP